MLTSATSFSECDGLSPRRRAICRGESGIPVNRADEYRVKWGLAPLFKEPQRSVHQSGSPLQPISGQLPPPNLPDIVKSGPGTELRKLFEGWKKYIPIEQDHDLDKETAEEVAAVGAASCLGCQGLEAKMNALGPDECEKIVDDIAAKVKENARKHKVRRLGITVDKLPLFDFTIRRLINKAIQKSREKN